MCTEIRITPRKPAPRKLENKSTNVCQSYIVSVLTEIKIMDSSSRRKRKKRTYYIRVVKASCRESSSCESL